MKERKQMGQRGQNLWKCLRVGLRDQDLRSIAPKDPVPCPVITSICDWCHPGICDSKPLSVTLDQRGGREHDKNADMCPLTRSANRFHFIRPISILMLQTNSMNSRHKTGTAEKPGQEHSRPFTAKTQI